MYFHYPLINRDFDYDAIIQWGHYVCPPPLSLFGQYLIWRESYWDQPSCCFIDFLIPALNLEQREESWGGMCRADTAERLTLKHLLSVQYCSKIIILLT